MSRFPGLKKDEISELSSNLLLASTQPKSYQALKFRKDFFHAKQKIAKIRFWFEKASSVQLTKQELSILKNNKKFIEWNIVGKIIKKQHLTGDEIIEWMELLKSSDQITISMTVLSKHKVNNEYKLDLVKKILNQNNIHYHRDVVKKMNDEINADTTGFWSQAYNIIFDEINKNDKKTYMLVKIWAESKELNNLAEFYDSKGKNMSSIPLYNATGKEYYLPKEAKDIFMF